MRSACTLAAQYKLCRQACIPAAAGCYAVPSTHKKTAPTPTAAPTISAAESARATNAEPSGILQLPALASTPTRECRSSLPQSSGSACRCSSVPHSGPIEPCTARLQQHVRAGWLSARRSAPGRLPSIPWQCAAARAPAGGTRRAGTSRRPTCWPAGAYQLGFCLRHRGLRREFLLNGHRVGKHKLDLEVGRHFARCAASRGCYAALPTSASAGLRWAQVDTRRPPRERANGFSATTSAPPSGHLRPPLAGWCAPAGSRGGSRLASAHPPPLFLHVASL